MGSTDSSKISGIQVVSLLAIVALLIMCVVHYAQNRVVGADAFGSATPNVRGDEAREAMYYTKLVDGSVQCNLCFRECIIADGEVGFCRNRQNRDGTLFSLVYARPSAVQVDPVEKEPLYHFKPGSTMLCIGTAGCNFRCSFCHNWHLSQKSIDEMPRVYDLTPHAVVQEALKREIPSISFTYNEPTTAYEYLYDVAKLAKQHGLNVIFHTNGSMKPEPLTELLKHTDAVTVDLKGFTEEFYAEVSQARLDVVLENLKLIKDSGVWLEIVNLVVPEYNDDPEQIYEMAQWIVENLGADVPLHFSRFFPEYKLTNLPPTPIETLERAYYSAKMAGLQYVTVGNVPGHPLNSTYCPQCTSPVITRVHFTVLDMQIEFGTCNFCSHRIPGIWD